MNAIEYAKIINDICSKLGIAEPDTTLIRNVTSYCKDLDQRRLKQLYEDDNDRYIAISDSYIQSITPREEFDYNKYLHDIQLSKKKEKKEKDGTIVGPLTDWIGNRMPVLSSKSMSMYIDSRLRNVSTSLMGASIVDFGFSIVPRATRTAIGDGNLPSRIMPSHVTYFKVGKIILPYSEILRNRNFSNEITLTFTALRSNGIISRDDTYHFTFTYEEPVNALDNLVHLIPVNKFCKFEPPIRNLDNLSLRFNDPIYPIPFHHDRMIPSNINYMSSDGRITFDIPHLLETGNVIVVLELSTLDNAANATILNVINDPRGIKITKIDDMTISTSIDFTKLVSQDINSLPMILFSNRTFRILLEVGYQDIVALDE